MEEFLEVLRDAAIELLVDVRRFPGSRRHPHFSKDQLAASLAEHGIAYEWWGEALGGRRNADASSDLHLEWRNAAFRAYAVHMDTDVFKRALADLERRALDTRVAIMCAETLWWRCHRRLIADALVADGYEVIHLGLGKDAPHRPGPGNRA
ncbi:MAG: DUF488 family protein [Actinomycetota bacterium]